MPLGVEKLRSILVKRKKLQAEESQGRRHEKYTVTYQGKCIAVTELSRSWSEVDDNMLGEIAKQLFITKPQLMELVRCPGTFDDYIQWVKQAGRLD